MLSLVQVLEAVGWPRGQIDILQLNTEEDDATMSACDLAIACPWLIGYSHSPTNATPRLALEMNLHRLGYHLRPWTETETLASHGP